MKRGEFSFVWIFAILAGGAILALAIWGVVQTGDIFTYGEDTSTAKSISILTNPLEAGFAEGSFGKISFKQETRLNNLCVDDGELGRDDLSVSTKSKTSGDWGEAGGAVSVHNKYIFSEETVDGFDFYVFSKSFEFPYEVSDLIFLTSGEYCFLNTPEEIGDEVSSLGIENIAFENCSSEAKRVCFDGGNDCDVLVYGSCSSGSCNSAYDYGVVSKNSGELRYVGNLIWGAIFADKDNYDCNVKRLLYRDGEIAEVFSEKADIMDARDCGTNLASDLIAWKSLVQSSDSDDLISLLDIAKNLENKNNGELCEVW